METPSFDKELICYIALLDEKQKKALLTLIKSFIKSKRITFEQYNRELDEANERINKGEFITMEELLTQMKNW